MVTFNPGWKRDAILTLFFLMLTLVLFFWPTGFENRLPDNSARCRGRIIETDDAEVKQFGIVKMGPQDLTVKILDGPFRGQEVRSVNQLIGKLELDKFFKAGYLF